MMKTEYLLRPTNFLYKIDEHFPKLQNGEKIGISVSGGMESTLISWIALQIYNPADIVFFYSDKIFCANDNITGLHIKTNIDKITKLLDIEPIYLESDYNTFASNRQQSIEDVLNFVKNVYDVVYVLFGFTKLFYDIEALKHPDMTIDRIKNLVFSDTKNFKNVIEEFHFKTDTWVHVLINIDIPYELYQLFRNHSSIIINPFKDLYKSEVVDFYRQLDLLNLLYGTNSCIEETVTKYHKHCGRCFNCQQRWDAFQILGDVQDLTEYQYSDIKDLRELLFLEERIYNTI